MKSWTSQRSLGSFLSIMRWQLRKMIMMWQLRWNFSGIYLSLAIWQKSLNISLLYYHIIIISSLLHFFIITLLLYHYYIIIILFFISLLLYYYYIITQLREVLYRDYYWDPKYLGCHVIAQECINIYRNTLQQHKQNLLAAFIWTLIFHLKTVILQVFSIQCLKLKCCFLLN